MHNDDDESEELIPGRRKQQTKNALFAMIASYYGNHNPRKDPTRTAWGIPAAFLLGIPQGVFLAIGDFVAFTALFTTFGIVNPFNFVRKWLGTGPLGTFVGGVAAIIPGVISLVVGAAVGAVHATIHAIASPFMAAYYSIKGFGLRNALANNIWFTCASLINTLFAMTQPFKKPIKQIQFVPANIDIAKDTEPLNFKSRRISALEFDRNKGIPTASEREASEFPLQRSPTMSDRSKSFSRTSRSSKKSIAGLAGAFEIGTGETTDIEKGQELGRRNVDHRRVTSVYERSDRGDSIDDSYVKLPGSAAESREPVAKPTTSRPRQSSAGSFSAAEVEARELAKQQRSQQLAKKPAQSALKKGPVHDLNSPNQQPESGIKRKPADVPQHIRRVGFKLPTIDQENRDPKSGGPHSKRPRRKNT